MKLDDNLIIDGQRKVRKSPKIPIFLSAIVLPFIIYAIYDGYFVIHTEFLGGLSVMGDYLIIIIGIGLLLLIWTIYIIVLAIAKKKNGDNNWWISLIVAILMIILPSMVNFIIYLIKCSLIR